MFSIYLNVCFSALRRARVVSASAATAASILSTGHLNKIMNTTLNYSFMSATFFHYVQSLGWMPSLVALCICPTWWDINKLSIYWRDRMRIGSALIDLRISAASCRCHIWRESFFHPIIICTGVPDVNQISPSDCLMLGVDFYSQGVLIRGRGGLRKTGGTNWAYFVAE